MPEPHPHGADGSRRKRITGGRRQRTCFRVAFVVAREDRSLPEGEVTMLFTDIEGSTRLAHELGDGWGDVLSEHYRILREVWAVHGGVEVDVEGDAFFVVFRYAGSAVAAAAAAQIALAGHRWPPGGEPRVRIGLHTGAPRVRDGNYWGVDVHYAARLGAAAHGGQVLISAATRALVADAPVEDLGEHAVKDFPASRHLYHLVVGGRGSGAFAPPRTLAVSRTNLPSIPTPLVGREHELRELEILLTGSLTRLVTLVGLGGTGKTRLAIACGARLMDAFPDGVFLVPLAPVAAAEGVPAALAEALAVAPQAELGPERAVIEHLRARRMLVIVDNLEHVLDAASLLGRLVDAAPGLRVLTTSQAPLRLTAETVLSLEALELPADGVSDPDALAEVPAVALFVERARAADPTFVLGETNAGSVAELCRRLEGLPLALELAAARVRVGGASGLLAALERGLDALGRGARDLPARQRGVRAALEHTVSLLGTAERELFAGLGAFADAWSIEDADAMFGGQLDTWEALATLSDFSLIRTRGDGRMTMAERVRAHARELLAGSGRERDARGRHAELMAQALESINRELNLDLAAQIARTRELLEEIDFALAWSRTAEPALYRRLLALCGRPFHFIARVPLVRDEIIRLAAADDGSDAVSGYLLFSRGYMEAPRGDVSAMRSWFQAAVECHRRTGTSRDLLTTLSMLGWMLMVEGRADEARAGLTESLQLAQAVDEDIRLCQHIEGTLAFVARTEGRYDEAEAAIAQIMSHPERTDFAALGAPSVWADCAMDRHDYDAALRRTVSALQQIFRRNDVINALGQLVVTAAALAALVRDAEAVELLGAADHAARHEFGLGDHAPRITRYIDIHLDAAARRLGDEAWHRCYAQGREHSLEEAIHWAVRLAEPDTTIVAALGPSSHSR
jgi:predicted ATPase/class 3 adenylate cyclase